MADPARYKPFRSVRDKNLHVVCLDDNFDELPAGIRQLGPWQGLTGGLVDQLLPHYRALLEEQGFVVVYRHLAEFEISAR